MISATVSKKKFCAVINTIAVFVIQWCISVYCFENQNAMSNGDALVWISIVSDIAFLIHLLTWKKLTGEFLTPYIIFLTVLFVFTCGQGIGWATGLDMGSKDMWDRVDHGITKAVLAQGLSYSMLGITAFQIGAILGKKVNSSRASKWNETEVLTAFRKIGKLMLIVCIPSFAAIMAQNLMAVANGGYAAYYVANQSRSVIMRLLSIFADFYQPCLLVLLIAYKENKTKRNLIIGAMLIDVVCSLYVGGRSGAVMTLLGILLAYHYFVNAFSRKQSIIVAIIGYFGAGVLNAIADIRQVTNRGIGDMITAIAGSFSNVLGQFIGELGWNITSICWTMILVPEIYPYRFGMSYLVSFVSWIPTAFFGEVHPAVVWGNLADWLQKAENMSYGPGYTMVAESYINFGYWGLVALLVEGFIIVKIIGNIDRRGVHENYLGATFQIIFIMTIMKSLIRSSTSVAMRNAFFVILPLYLLVKIALTRSKAK